MTTKQEVRVLADRIGEIGVKVPKKPLKEVGYPNLALCVVDTVFSRQQCCGTASEAVRSLQAYWDGKGFTPPVTARRFTLKDFLDKVDTLSESTLVGKVFKCDQRALGVPTLSRAAVAVELCRNLQTRGVESKADLRDPERQADIAAAIKETRGVGAVALAYLLQLAGADVADAPAKWVVDFVAGALDRSVEVAEVPALIEGATRRLSKKTPKLTAIDVEQAIWANSFGFAKKPNPA